MASRRSALVSGNDEDVRDEVRDFRIVEVLPDFAQEVVAHLRAEGEHGLAARFPELPIVGRCSCRQWNCATFDTAVRTSEIDYDYSIPISGSGHVAIDLDTDGRVIQVEVLDRPEVRTALEVREIPSKPDCAGIARVPSGVLFLPQLYGHGLQERGRC